MENWLRTRNTTTDGWWHAATDGPLFDRSSSEAGFDEEDVDEEYASLFDIDELFEKEE